MPKVAWINPASGVSGDMCLGALCDLGADQFQLLRTLKTIPLGEDFELDFARVSRGGLRSLHCKVVVAPGERHRTVHEILSLIESSGLSLTQKEGAKATFERLAQVEAEIHGVEVKDVQLHEVGSLDAIIDICGFMVARDLLGLDEIYYSAPALGAGLIQSTHGTLSVPAPAVVALLAGSQAYGGPDPFELTTPTGAAILTMNAKFVSQMPRMTIESVGYGAGTKELGERPNVLQVVLGLTVNEELEQRPFLPGHFEDVVELETNIDDISGELAGFVIATIMAKGALDAFAREVLAKKGRPGFLLSVLVSVGDVARISTEIFSLTGTLGIRTTQKERFILERRTISIEVLGMSLEVKVGPIRAKVEFDQLIELSRRTNRPVLELERLVQVEIAKLLAPKQDPPSDRLVESSPSR